MPLFVVRHSHQGERCPAQDPYMGAMLLNHLSRPNVRRHGGELRALAPTLRNVLNDAVSDLDRIIEPGKPDGPLSEPQRLQARALFDTIAKALTEAAK